MQVLTPRQAIKGLLAANNLDHIENPHDLFEHIAFTLRDHEDFRRLLDKCPPEKRRVAYEKLKPMVQFIAKSLSVYLAENAAAAERDRLPSVMPDGTLIPFRPVKIRSDEYIAEQALAASKAKKHLWLICGKCTKEAEFSGEHKSDAIRAARAAGWTYDEISGAGREICPDCP